MALSSLYFDDDDAATAEGSPPDAGAYDGPVLRRRRIPDDSEMDITPMIDIVFLLLIFFIVSSIPDPSTAVELPMAEYGAGVDIETTAAVTIAVGASPDLPRVYLAAGRVESEILPDDEASQTPLLEAYLAAALAEGKSAVLIKAEREVRHRHVARIARLAGQQGLTTHVAVLEAP